MFSTSRRHHSVDIWPGFVDAMATLLMVIVFVLMTFVMAQLYLTDALNGRENDVLKLNGQVKDLETQLQSEVMSKQKIQDTLQLLKNQVSHLQAALQTSEKTLIQETEERARAEKSLSELVAQVEALNTQLDRLNHALGEAEAINKNQAETMMGLRQQFSDALLKKVEELKDLNEKLMSLQGDRDQLEKELKKMKDPKKLGLTQFRSEFFAKLTKIIGERGDIRIVGDRFVFQSEVLFDKGSSDIKDQGRQQLKTLANTLKDISIKIPKDISWILRIDGHTDQLPIKSAQFPSNWELSSARAIAVVKFLVAEGISPHNLVAAGFGEYQPLGSQGKSEADLAKNRRIEFKLDQR